MDHAKSKYFVFDPSRGSRPKSNREQSLYI